LYNIAQRRQDFGHPTFAAFVDLRAAFDCLSRPVLWLIIFVTPDGSTKTRKNTAVNMKNTHNYRRKIKRKTTSASVKLTQTRHSHSK